MEPVWEIEMNEDGTLTQTAYFANNTRAKSTRKTPFLKESKKIL
jgi:hypothetical protein